MIFVDTSFFIEFFKGNEKARLLYDKILSKERTCSSLNVLEETTYILMKRIAMEKSINIFDLEKNPKVFVECMNVVEKFYKSLIMDLDITILPLNFSWDIVLEMCKRYSLLPNDALIAATCRFYGIRRIATFDDDFRRVKFLKVVEV